MIAAIDPMSHREILIDHVLEREKLPIAMSIVTVRSQRKVLRLRSKKDIIKGIRSAAAMIRKMESAVIQGCWC